MPDASPPPLPAAHPAGYARTLTYRHEATRFREAFRISGYVFDSMPSIVAEIALGEVVGRGEAAGIYYLDDGPDHMAAAIEHVRPLIESGIARDALRRLFPAGGGRNALDCALWELESRLTNIPVWKMAGGRPPHRLTTTFTLGADAPDALRTALAGFAAATSIKLKLDGDVDADLERVATVRQARPDVWLAVDANQGYSDGTSFDRLVAALADARVSLLEQPIPRGQEALLEGWISPIPIAADESILDLAELEQRGRLFDTVNIKLDKCGGLTEALEMESLARRMGLRVMVGNMGGSTLATAPAFVLAQRCDIVDLDGPHFLADDPLAASLYEDGRIFVPASYWGAADGQRGHSS